MLLNAPDTSGGVIRRCVWWRSVCVCVWSHVHVFMRACARVCLCVCMRRYLCLLVSVCVTVCAYVPVSVCVCVCVCVCKYPISYAHSECTWSAAVRVLRGTNTRVHIIMCCSHCFCFNLIYATIHGKCILMITESLEATEKIRTRAYFTLQTKCTFPWKLI